MGLPEALCEESEEEMMGVDEGGLSLNKLRFDSRPVHIFT